MRPEHLVYKKLILDAVVMSVTAFRNGDNTAFELLEAYVADIAGKDVAKRVVEAVKKNIECDIPTIVDEVSKVIDEVMNR